MLCPLVVISAGGVHMAESWNDIRMQSKGPYSHLAHYLLLWALKHWHCCTRSGLWVYLGKLLCVH